MDVIPTDSAAIKYRTDSSGKSGYLKLYAIACPKRDFRAPSDLQPPVFPSLKSLRYNGEGLSGISYVFRMVHPRTLPS